MPKIEEEGVEEPKKKKSKLLLIILLVLILAALGGGGYFAWTKFFQAQPAETAGEAPAEGEKKPEEKKEAAKKDEKKDEKKEEKKDDKKKDDKNKPVTSINNIVTNLADPGGKRYVRMSVEFDFKDSAVAAEFGEKYQARVKDAILTLLWSKTSEELSNVDGMLAFRTELQARVNQIMGPGAVKQVFITDRVIQ